MKALSFLSAACGVLFMGAASAADITVYYSPTCPHCHHAREFISSTLIYEYPQLKVTEVNVMEEANYPLFQETLKKCEYESGGVPVLVIGEKCFQGYADSMQGELREAVEVGLSDEDKAAAAENKKAMEIIEKNLTKTKFLNRSTLIKKDVISALSVMSDSFDIVFMDPPYALGIEGDVLTKIRENRILRKDGFIIIEADLNRDFSFVSELGYEITRMKQYKNNQ